MLLFLLAVLVGFVLLAGGADRFVTGAAATARDLGVSPLIIGLVIVGFGTSAPEMLVSAMAAWNGAPGLAIGNALGSNIANIGLVLGVSALISPIAVHSDTLRREFPILFAVMVICLLLFSDHFLSRWDGLLLLTGLLVIMYWLIALAMRTHTDPLEVELEQEIPGFMPLSRALLWLLLGLATLLIGSRLLVWGGVSIAQALGVSELIIGLTVVAIGTSLPELATSIASAVKGEHDIAIGNILGSNMFNLMGVVGIAGVIHPTFLEAHVLNRDYAVMTAFTVALFAVAYGFRGPGHINRWEGGLLAFFYIVYLTWLYMTT